MNAVEVRGAFKRYGTGSSDSCVVLNQLNMTVPQGAM